MSDGWSVLAPCKAMLLLARVRTDGPQRFSRGLLKLSQGVSYTFSRTHRMWQRIYSLQARRKTAKSSGTVTRVCVVLFTLYSLNRPTPNLSMLLPWRTPYPRRGCGINRALPESPSPTSGPASGSEGTKTSAAPSMHHRRPVTAAGVPGNRSPSENMSPRCPPHRAQRTSDPKTPPKAPSVSMADERGAANDGHPANTQERFISTQSSATFDLPLHAPVPLSNFCVESNNGAAQPAHTNTPRRFSLTSGELFGGSVPPCRNM